MPSVNSKLVKKVNYGSKRPSLVIVSAKKGKLPPKMLKIIIEEINEDFSRGKYGDFEVIIMNSNGFINATKLCGVSVSKNGLKKEFKYWKANISANEIMEEISSLIGIPKDDLLVTITTGNKNLTKIRGTYVHPLLITHIASWISPKFAVKMGLWIEEWKKYSNENLIEYYENLAKLEPSKNLCKERKIQKKLQKKYGGDIEVETEFGDIDLLTDELLIEIKAYKNWKCAVGQLIIYSLEYPDRKKYMYLFDISGQKTSHIKKVCKKYDIKLVEYD